MEMILDPELEFPEAYMRNEILIQNGSLEEFSNVISRKSWSRRNYYG